MAGAARTAKTRATQQGSEKRSRPQLRVIDHRSLRSQANRRSMYLAAGLLFVLGLFAVALAQAELVKGQAELDQLRTHLEDVEARREMLRREVDQASAPDDVVSRARALGMVRASDPVYFTALRSNGEGAP